MANFSTHFANAIIDHMLRNQAYTPASTIYLALFTAAPTDAGGGTEVVGGSYARQAITLSAASGGATSNTVAIEFTCPACTVVAAGIYDTNSGGNLLAWNTVTNKTLGAGDIYRVPVGDLDISADTT